MIYDAPYTFDPAAHINCPEHGTLPPERALVCRSDRDGIVVWCAECYADALHDLLVTCGLEPLEVYDPETLTLKEATCPRT